MALDVAVDNLLALEPGVTGLVGDRRYSSGRVPEGVAGNYLVYQSSAETSRGVFANRALADTSLEIHGWGVNPGKTDLAALYAALYTALDRRSVALAGGEVKKLYLSLLNLFWSTPDQRMHLVAAVRAL
jgi:hypothetical protein